MSIIGITMGDPAGVGAEITLKALSHNTNLKSDYVVFGSYEVMNYYKSMLKITKELNNINDLSQFDKNKINIIDVMDLKMVDFQIGKVSAICGDAAFRYIEKAIKYALEGKIKGVVTAPLNKEALHLGGHNYDGHTEIFAKLTETKKYSMMLTSKSLRVIHVSTHTSLRNACDKVKKDRVLDVIKLANETLIKMGVKEPKIGVAGLNPHAGESGIFGDEDIKEIKPAVEGAEALGIKADGPIPPDTVFLKALKGQYDIVVCMYHDQGHIPLKLLGFDIGVNVTVGLPIIRTSVDHGTAFDIAGKGKAGETSMIEAMKVAEMFL
ncbi:4-hydroxythreonine-4-phosphate dehydrogenase PdxA [Clostridium sp. DJ247]|uniref:4-hydroxythreonine-4-phosphate dehydrogenase PdxA n=1 Tax=Clostridium sp. DJ247 TaxID=2726188 RepID=UPI001623EFA5|nr:4-hydroxythreonine-4-phosphate dehydrogenase PdxA [Clostridium sp. DJ247]MBC2580516.1 4-hydroxythreonine-4-phosphate dehydrogenase PdxA [Clostridium sp. DJ247]